MTKSKSKQPVALSPEEESNSQIDFNTPSVHGTVRPILKKRNTQNMVVVDEQSELSQVNNQMVNVTAVDDLLEKRSMNMMIQETIPDNESQAFGFEEVQVKNAAPPKSYHDKSATLNQTENQDAPPEDINSQQQHEAKSQPIHSPFKLSEKKTTMTVNTKLKHKSSFRPGIP